jgi:hypothetical protein
MDKKPIEFFEKKNWSKQGCYDYLKKKQFESAELTLPYRDLNLTSG